LAPASWFAISSPAAHEDSRTYLEKGQGIFFTQLSPQLLGISLFIRSPTHVNNEHFHVEKTSLPKKWALARGAALPQYVGVFTTTSLNK
jgi:hypothetical protein